MPRFWIRSILLVSLAATIGVDAQNQTRTVTVESLLYDLKHPDAERRRQAAVTLGQNRVHEAVPGLIELTRDPASTVRLEALKALVRINDRRAVAAYVQLTADSDRTIQENAIDALIGTYTVEENSFGERVRRVADLVNPFSDDYDPLVVEPYVSVDPSVYTALAALLDQSQARVRRQAAYALGVLRAHPVLGRIQQQLRRETNDSVKVELIRAIYKIGDSSAGEAVLPLIHDPDKKVHDEAIYTVGRLKVAGAVQPLTAIYDSGASERRKILKVVPVTGRDDLQRNVYQALSFIGDASSRELFRDGLVQDKEFYRRYGAEGLARIADPQDTSMVARSYVREQSTGPKLALSFALYRLGRTEHLDELVLQSNRDQAQNYLLEFEAAEVAQLLPYLERERSAVVIRLLEIVGMRGGQDAVQAVERLTASEDTDVVAAANRALRRLNGRL